MSILTTSPISTRHFDMNIAEALGDVNAAVIVQQLNYWMQKEGVGVVINGVKYIYNTFVDWVSSQFKWLSVWQFRKAMSLLRSLSIVKVIRYRSKQWNQTNYYSLDRDRLAEFINLEMAVDLEISELRSNTPQGERSCTLEMRDSELSLYETKNTNQKKTAKQKQKCDPEGYAERNRQSKESPLAAASPKSAKDEDINQKGKLPHLASLTASPSQIEHKSETRQSNLNKKTNIARVDYIINKKWEKMIPLLDSAGISINKTIEDVLKLYPKEKVESAIALLKARKRDGHIPNPSGYFVAALKGDWGSKQILKNSESSIKVDTAAVFRYWYDLARELGYCSGQEIREGEQWVCLSGSWEKWEDAVNRGYSLDYLKKIMKRNQNQ